MLATRAVDNSVFFGYVNLVGGQDELVFDGGSMVFDPQGELIASSQQFEEDLLVVDLEVEEVLRTRLREPLNRKEDQLVTTDVGKPKKYAVSDYNADSVRPSVHRQALADLAGAEQEVYEALVLGTRDYLMKTGFKKALIALSGGIDSSIKTSVISRIKTL
jgi:NAD+ synthase (glutamine-hydrolysing)